MVQIFTGINSALRGLEAEQAAMATTSHNIANASTRGYSRQSVELTTTDPITDPSLLPAGAGQMGTGVAVASISRAYDTFIQQQVLYQNSVQTQQQAVSDTLDRVDQVFNEPTSQGFGTLLSNFFTAWQSLANNPSDPAAREVVAAQGAALASGFNTAAASLHEQQANQDSQIPQLVNQVNDITGQIAALNVQITGVLAEGQQPNDLKDKRDTLLNDLSKLVQIHSVESSNGAVSVSLSGAGALVQGASQFKLTTVADPNNPSFTALAFQGQPGTVAVTGGQLGAAFQNRDVTIASRITAMDTLAGNVVNAVNTIHAAGFGSNNTTGITFFTGNSAASMAVDPRVSGNPANIATAAGPNQPGDNTIASRLAALQDTPPAGSPTTLQNQYGQIISQLGVDGQQAHDSATTGGLLLQQLNAQQSSVSGVSLDQEAGNLIQYQAAYQAAARVISIMDQSITDMIQHLGG